ncbi:MAG: ATP-binding protein [Bacteroidales bacterium]
MKNPFITTGYVSAAYFCDRERETEAIVSLLTNENNIALISPRRYGKTALIRHCLQRPEITDHYYTFLIDIYATRSLRDFVNKLGKAILDTLKPKGRKVWEHFITSLKTLSGNFTYDINGTPSWSVSLGDIENPNVTLDEIFYYLQNADKPCIVAIDEFQQISKYPEENIEAIIRTHVQYCNNAAFIFSGSQRHLMGTIFTSPARPFYQSVTVMNLPLIPKDKYADFAIYHFEQAGKKIDREVIDELYKRFDGATFYLQKVLNILFQQTPKDSMCGVEMIDSAIDYIIDFTADTYAELLYQLPEKQKQILIAINNEGNATGILSSAFVKKYGLTSASSVKSAVNGLLDKDFITQEREVYKIYDLFFGIWLRSQ